MDILAEN